jgi:hypothetical protein
MLKILVTTGFEPFNRRNDISALAALVGLILLANLLILCTHFTYQYFHAFSYDFEYNYQAGHALFMQSWGRGCIPLWGPLMCGSPDSALYAPGMLHPSFLLMRLSSVQAVVAFNTVLHLELIGCFSYLLFRRLGISIAAALAAALWSALSGYSIWVSPLQPVLNALPWFIAWMWAVLEFLSRPRLRWWALQTMVLTLLLTSGDIQELVFCAYLGGLWLALIIVFSRDRNARTVATLAGGIVLALMIASYQLLISLNFFTRVVKTASFTWSFYRAALPTLPELLLGTVGLLSKRFEGLFICLATGVVAVLGLRRHRESAPLKAAIVTVALALLFLAGARYGLGHLLRHLPLLGKMIRNYKMGIALQPLLMIIAAYGADSLLRQPGPERSRAWLLGGLALAAALLSRHWLASALLAVLAAALMVKPVARRHWAPAIIALAFLECVSVLWHPLSEFPRWRYWDRFTQACRDAGAEYRVGAMYPTLAMARFDYLRELPFTMAATMGEESFDVWFSYPLKAYASLLSLISPACLVQDQNGIRSVDFTTPFRSSDYIRPSNRHLVNLLGLRYIFAKDFALEEADRYPILSDPAYLLNPARKDAFAPYQRMVRVGPDGEQPVLEIEAPGTFTYHTRLGKTDRLRFGIEASGPPGSAPLMFELHASGKNGSRIWFQQALAPGGVEADRELGLDDFPELQDGDSEIRLDFTVIFPVGPAPGKFKARWIDPTFMRPEKTIRWKAGSRMMMLENTEAIPRGRVVHEALPARDEAEAAGIMKDPARYDPRRQAVLLGAPGGFPVRGKASNLEEHVRTVSYSYDDFQVEADLATPGLLVWAGNYFPGWRAWVDGQEVRIFRADLCFRAVALDAGRHSVHFSYQPPEFRIGLFLSLGSLLILGLAGIGVFGRKPPDR